MGEEEKAILDQLRLEVGEVTDGDGAPLCDEAIIFFDGDDGSSEIRISAPNARYIADRLADLWNTAGRTALQERI